MQRRRDITDDVSLFKNEVRQLQRLARHIRNLRELNGTRTITHTVAVRRDYHTGRNDWFINPIVRHIL